MKKIFKYIDGLFGVEVDGKWNAELPHPDRYNYSMDKVIGIDTQNYTFSVSAECVGLTFHADFLTDQYLMTLSTGAGNCVVTRKDFEKVRGAFTDNIKDPYFPVLRAMADILEREGL